MIGNIERDSNGKIISQLSLYKPSKDVADFTGSVKKDYSYGHDILNRGWTELNDESIISDMNRGRLMFNAFVDESYESPGDAWKWRGTRSMARNKGIAMHANLTAAYLLPTFQAQNEDDEVDRDFSEFMTDLVEWMAQDENSDYKTNFLSLVFAMESDPIVYLGAEFAEIPQKIKIMGEDGKYTKKEILDEVLSGFKSPIYTADQILISNAFERNLQKHRFNGKRRWIEYEEARAKYGTHPNWDCVKAGFTTVYNEDDGLFYDIKDDQHPSLVEEFTPAYRRDDTEVCFIGGIYMGNENIDDNPIRHRDNFNAPRYNVVQFGFYPIGSHFIFYKSMMNAMRWDNALYDASTEILANRAMLEAEFPVAISGSDKIDEDIVYPNAVVTLQDKDAKVQKLLPDSNLGNLVTSLNLTEESMADASVSETLSGNLPAASQKAYVVAQAQANSKKIIGGVAKGLAGSVARYGLLMSDIAINHLTVPQVDDLVGTAMKLKYRKFTLDNKQIGSKRYAKQLLFEPDLIGEEMTQEEKDMHNLALLQKAGYPDHEKHIYMANPELFARRKYLSRADYREVFPTDDTAMQQILLALKTTLIQDPTVDQAALTRELMYATFKSRGDKFILDKQQQDLLATAKAGAPKQQAPAPQNTGYSVPSLSPQSNAPTVT